MNEGGEEHRYDHRHRSLTGDIYFTDPPYGLRQPDGSFVGQELDCYGVYRCSPADGRLTLLIDDFVRPNGLVLNAAETQLFICDTERHHVRVFDMGADGTLRNGRVFVELTHADLVGRPDGMKMDVEGNLYVAGSTPEGLWVFNPEGRLIGLIGVPEGPANLAWGGVDWKTLFVTARTSVYRIPMKVAGMPVAL
ncbi:MAG: SMP-30/gluconolactonase/LRE family protein [Nitrospinae bacterium]|nr:SMP-30/gluconolactonase/LRE family protein [Nitrospinota bacterium]